MTPRTPPTPDEQPEPPDDAPADGTAPDEEAAPPPPLPDGLPPVQVLLGYMPHDDAKLVASMLDGAFARWQGAQKDQEIEQLHAALAALQPQNREQRRAAAARAPRAKKKQ